MKLRYLLFALWLVGMPGLWACHQQEAPPPPNPNAGKHLLAKADPRNWEGYPALLLVATRHGVGVDTAAALIAGFCQRFHYSDLPLYDVQLPYYNESFQEDVPQTADDQQSLAALGQRFGLSAAETAALISDFYVLGGSNRDFPQTEGN